MKGDAREDTTIKNETDYNSVVNTALCTMMLNKDMQFIEASALDGDYIVTINITREDKYE